MEGRKKLCFLPKNCDILMSRGIHFIIIAFFCVQSCTALQDRRSWDWQSTVYPKPTHTNEGSSQFTLTDGQSPGSDYSVVDVDVTHSLTTPAQPIVSSCTAFIHEFSDAAAAYTKCSILNSRPLRFCEQCVDVYVAAKESYDVIMEGEFHDETGALCKNVILNSDRIQIVVQTYHFVEHIWQQCNCEGCFTHNGDGYEINNDTLHFFELANHTMHCFSNFTHEIQPISNQTIDPAVCDTCLHAYDAVNQYYDHLQEHQSDYLCMDIVDMMNSTRYMWSQVFHCSHRDVDIVPVALLTVFFCTLPVIFYVSNKIHGTKTAKKLFKQKRMTESQANTSVEEEQLQSS